MTIERPRCAAGASSMAPGYPSRIATYPKSAQESALSDFSNKNNFGDD